MAVAVLDTKDSNFVEINKHIYTHLYDSHTYYIRTQIVHGLLTLWVGWMEYM